MSKFTPGPWEVTPDGHRIWAQNGAAGNGTVPACCAHNKQERTEESRANAQLISAVHDLLDAAKLTVLMFQRQQASDSFHGDDEHEAWSALQRAISKAEGEK